jgi:hypothetical protein
MASAALTVQKLARNKMSTGPDHIPAVSSNSLFSTGLGAENSTDGPDFYVEDFADFDNLYIALYIGSSAAKAGFQVSSTGCTFGSEGIGDFVWKATANADTTAGVPPVFIFGPFDASRFKDVSTGGNKLTVSFGTSGTSAGLAGSKIAAFAVVPNT